MSFLLALLFALLVGCETYAPTASSNQEQPTAQNSKKGATQGDTINEECGSCGNPPPPGNGGGGGGWY